KTYDFSSFPLKLPRRKRTFRIVLSEENEMISIKSPLLLSLSKKLGRALSLRLDGSRPSSEFWFIKRSSGAVFFTMRLTYHPDYTKSLPKGALRPELAYLICLTANVTKTDTVWDPFAGYGTIPIACETHFSPQKLIANEHNSNLAGRMKNVRHSLKLHFEVTKQDVLQSTLPDESITKIISDPPWGSFEKITKEDFYESMLKEFSRVLTPNGTCTLLVGESSSLNEVINESHHFKIKKAISTLVAGKKATVYSLSKA
ncbi:methyltransferase, partial [candidate division WWE3 bacterium]|nr:methyltransferase [candidate division WWE3 bacterium]